MSGSYQGPNEGFRGVVKRAAMKALDAHNRGNARHDWVCPSCGATLHQNDVEAHAEACGELRADVASDL